MVEVVSADTTDESDVLRKDRIGFDEGRSSKYQ
jgi:hypothetical protein